LGEYHEKNHKIFIFSSFAACFCTVASDAPETECVEKFISACINDKPNLEEIKTISKKYKNEIHEDTVKIVIITLVQTGGDKQFKIIKYLFENFALNISPSGLIAKALDFACSKNHTEIAEYIYEKASINKSK
jgi:hypothetical protein